MFQLVAFLPRRKDTKDTFFWEVQGREVTKTGVLQAMRAAVGIIALLVSSAEAQLGADLSREQLKPLTAFRQQHRRLVRAESCVGT